MARRVLQDERFLSSDLRRALRRHVHAPLGLLTRGCFRADRFAVATILKQIGIVAGVFARTQTPGDASVAAAHRAVRFRACAISIRGARAAGRAGEAVPALLVARRRAGAGTILMFGIAGLAEAAGRSLGGAARRVDHKSAGAADQAGVTRGTIISVAAIDRLRTDWLREERGRNDSENKKKSSQRLPPIGETILSGVCRNANRLAAKR